MCIEGMIHGISGTVITVSQVPQQLQHLDTTSVDKGKHKYTKIKLQVSGEYNSLQKTVYYCHMIKHLCADRTKWQSKKAQLLAHNK